MYVEQCTKFKSFVDQEAQCMVDDPVEKWMVDNARAREVALWDWCLLWLVLSQDGVLQKLPPLPWRHDRKSTTLVMKVPSSCWPSLVPTSIYIHNVLLCAEGEALCVRARLLANRTPPL